ncbi:MAG: NAD(P)/FAD-dependent oxidoreductase, partial [Candidatus Aenigmatarchaeota archaeon]
MEKLVFIGGGHAHLSCILNIEEFLELGMNVTVISPSEYLYYSGMGPGLLGGFYEPSECRFNIKGLVDQAGGEFIKEKVTQVDPEIKELTLESGKQISYDIASFDVGSYIPSENLQIKESEVILVKPISNLVEVRQEIKKLKSGQSVNVCIVGGGPSGTELAGNVWRTLSKHKLNFKITLITDDLLLSEHPIKIRNYALKSLKERGVEVKENQTVERIENNIL